MLGSNVLVRKALSLLGSISQNSLLNGRSTEVESFSRIVMCPSICFRVDSTESYERSNLKVRPLSSRRSPNSRCSVSM